MESCFRCKGRYRSLSTATVRAHLLLPHNNWEAVSNKLHPAKTPGLGQTPEPPNFKKGLKKM
eukprot:5190015-Amphidinium_carterae.1